MPEDNEANSFSDFSDRFFDLMKEAQGYGIRSMVALNDSDPLSDEEERACLHSGGFANAIGLAAWAQKYLLSKDD